MKQLEIDNVLDYVHFYALDCFSWTAERHWAMLMVSDCPEHAAKDADRDMAARMGSGIVVYTKLPAYPLLRCAVLGMYQGGPELFCKPQGLTSKPDRRI